jgi:hypothetical protein
MMIMRGTVLLLVAAAACALSACNQSATPAGAGRPPVPSSPEPPVLWSIESQDDRGEVTKTILICADSAVRRSFSRPLPSPNGKPCQLLAPPVDNGDRFAARCKTGSAHLDIQSERTGDPDRDFVIKLLVRSDISGGENLAQTLHYRRLGDCPNGWTIGDSGAPGDRKVVNSTSGIAHDLSSPIQPPAH